MNKVLYFLIGFFGMWLVVLLIRVEATYDLKQTIEIQKQTIYRLNNQLSKMDTLHDECFKMSEIRNAKNK